MIRSPLGIRINPAQSIKEQIQEAARLGAKGVVADATGDLSADRLSETGRRELRHLLRSTEICLVALNLPTRRPFDTEDQLDDRINRAERAFGLAFDVGSKLVLARVGAVPPEADAGRRAVFTNALRELGRRADHRGVRLAIETGTDAGETVRWVLDWLDNPGLAASIDPASLLANGHDPAATSRALGPWVAHAYAPTPTGKWPAARIIHTASSGLPQGAIDWVEYLGALEEIGFRGFLTLWPDEMRDTGSQFTALVDRLSKF